MLIALFLSLCSTTL